MNLFGVRSCSEAEFVLAVLKVIAVIGFIILGIILNCGVGRGGYSRYIGNCYYTEVLHSNIRNEKLGPGFQCSSAKIIGECFQASERRVRTA